MSSINKYTLTVNGQKKTVEALPDTPLLWILRDSLAMTATKFGCGVSDCGACTVLVDGKARRSCQVEIGDLGDKKVTTLEGLSKDGTHPVQVAWMEEDVPQCGYCQAGQIMSAVALLKANPHPSDAEIDAAMDGNLCRCGTYQRIKNAIKRASKTGGEM